MQMPEKKKPPVRAANLSQKPQRKQTPPRKSNADASEQSHILPTTPDNKADQSMTKKAPPRKTHVKKAPPRKASLIAATAASVTSDTLAQDIKDIAYSISSADAPTAPLLDNENGNWDDFVETFTAERDPFNPDHDYSYTDRSGERRTSAVPVTAKNYYGYIVPRCKGARNNKALTKQQHIALDYDALPVGTMDALLMALVKAGAAHIVYTTASHLTKKKGGLECFRLVVPMDQPVTTIRDMVAVRVALADVLARQIPALVVDRASFTPSQPMFLPVHGSEVYHDAGRSQSVNKLLVHFMAAGLSVHVPRVKEGGAVVPEGIDKLFEPVMDMLIEWGATNRDDSGRMLVQANEAHAEGYSTDSKPDDFAFMFPMDGIAEVFNVSAIHGSDLDEMDQWKRRNPKKKGESIAAYTERRRLAGIQYAIDACAPDAAACAKMTVLMNKTIEAHKGTILAKADEGDLAFDDDDKPAAPSAKKKQAQAIADAVQKVQKVADLDAESYEAMVDLKLMEDDDTPAILRAAEWLKSPALSGCVLAWDNFRSDVVFKPYGSNAHIFDRMTKTQKPGMGGWYFATDDLITKARLAIARELPDCNLTARDVSALLDHQAKENPIDTAQEWAGSLEWDGVPRAETFFIDYLGADDTPYTRAAALSFWSGAGGRLLVPGTKQDQTIILVGRQGIAKSTSIRAMVPDDEWAGAINFTMSEEARIRRMRGKLLLEISEMGGFNGKKRDEIKTFMTEQTDEMVRKYKERSERTDRRAVFIGTSNETEILHDATGERRWLPISATRGDIDGIKAVRDQLWAEGIALFRANGVMWQRAHELAAPQHERFKESDTWEESILAWIDEQIETWNGQVTVADIAIGALGFADVGRISKADEKRIGAILRRNKWENRLVYVAGKRARRWVKEE